MELEDKKILESIKNLKSIPFNYKYIHQLFSEDSVKNGEVEIVRPIAVNVYQTDFYVASQHHKPISKIVNYSLVINNESK